MSCAWKKRTELLLGEAKIAALAGKNILIAGIGGVGGFASEALIRSGIGSIKFVDGDCVDESNINRQIVATTSTLGKAKVEVMLARAKEINPQGNFIAEKLFLTTENIATALSGFDLVVDCIDDVPAKVEMLYFCCRNGIPCVSSMGAAEKQDPTAVQIADISKSFNCNLAKKVRHELRQRGVFEGITVVFSSEKAPAKPANNWRELGSFAPVVGAFGCAVAAAAIKLLDR